MGDTVDIVAAAVVAVVEASIKEIFTGFRAAVFFAARNPITLHFYSVSFRTF